MTAPTEKAALEKTLQEARRKFYLIEQAERKEENAKLAGKCFRYRNCYSCPQGEKDKWWLYGKVLRLDGHGNPIMHKFQTDKNGKVEIEMAATEYCHLKHGWQPIRQDEFTKAWRALLSRLQGGTGK